MKLTLDELHLENQVVENFPRNLACVADALNLLYIADYIYKWFSRARGPAATQAIETLQRSFHRGEKTEISGEASWEI